MSTKAEQIFLQLFSSTWTYDLPLSCQTHTLRPKQPQAVLLLGQVGTSAWKRDCNPGVRHHQRDKSGMRDLQFRRCLSTLALADRAAGEGWEFSCRILGAAQTQVTSLTRSWAFLKEKERGTPGQDTAGLVSNSTAQIPPPELIPPLIPDCSKIKLNVPENRNSYWIGLALNFRDFMMDLRYSRVSSPSWAKRTKKAIDWWDFCLIAKALCWHFVLAFKSLCKSVSG